MPNSILQFPAAADPAALVDRAALLKDKITTLTDELRQINETLAGTADFKPGSKTGHISGRHFAAKISLRENVKWDQPRLNEARAVMGDAEFFRVFKWTFEPVSAKTLAGALEFGQHAELIEAARTVTEGTPYVTFEKLESC